jgi:Uma2 family endonuclease
MGTELAHGTRAWRMSGAEFRAFQNGRPEHERWELIAGVPMMMLPPTMTHNHIADNLHELLAEALRRHDPSRRATQRPGLELTSDDYRPEPDVAVIDSEYEMGQRFVERAYLLAEIVSGTDLAPIPGGTQTWIAAKREIYLAHEPCEAVLIIEQDRMEVHLDLKEAEGWETHVLGADDELLLPSFGLRCPVKALYQGTPLQPRAARRT